MTDVAFSMRVVWSFAGSVFAASVGVGIGLVGPLGFLIFPFFLPFVLITAGPGAGVLGGILCALTEQFARKASGYRDIWWRGLLLGLPLAALNSVSAAAILGLFNDESFQSQLERSPLLYLSGAFWGWLGAVYGACAGLHPGGRP